MRRLVLGLALMVPVAVVGAQASWAAKKKPTCSVKGSKTVVKNKSARVYTRAVNRGDTIARLYGCLNSNGRKTLLDTSSDDGLATSVAFSQVKLSGRYAAWEHVVN